MRPGDFHSKFPGPDAAVASNYAVVMGKFNCLERRAFQIRKLFQSTSDFDHDCFGNLGLKVGEVKARVDTGRPSRPAHDAFEASSFQPVRRAELVGLLS